LEYAVNGDRLRHKVQLSAHAREGGFPRAVLFSRGYRSPRTAPFWARIPRPRTEPAGASGLCRFSNPLLGRLTSINHPLRSQRGQQTMEPLWSPVTRGQSRALVLLSGSARGAAARGRAAAAAPCPPQLEPLAGRKRRLVPSLVIHAGTPYRQLQEVRRSLSLQTNESAASSSVTASRRPSAAAGWASSTGPTTRA
jgi:hypothetical protein